MAVDAQNSVIKELKGKTASLTWTIIKSSGETILNGGINSVRPRNANSVAVAFIGLNNAVTVVSTYSDRGWTVSLTSQSLVLSAKNLKEEDDATYTLNLFHQTGGKVESKSKAIRLKVLGKLTYMYYHNILFYIRLCKHLLLLYGTLYIHYCMVQYIHYCMVHGTTSNE